MIKFFRHIRQNMIKNNRRSQYMLYAFGEIILVVMGILIALQINNWNEFKKNRAFEEEILTQVQVNLIKDKLTLESISSNFEKAITSSNKVLKEKWNNQDMDSLKFWLGDIIQFDRFQPLTNAYDVLKSKGLDQISNKQLRFLMGEYYDDKVSHTIKSIGDVETTFNRDWLPILKEHGEDFKFKTFVIFKDVSIFKESHQAKYLLKMNIDNFNGGNNRIQQTILIIDKIQNLITKELN